MNITLRQVQAFVTTAKRGSVSRAAEEMGMTQAAVSSLIRQMEEAAGLVLFERTNRRVVPTDAGHRLLALGSALIAQHTAFLNGLRDEARSRERSVGFAVSPALATTIVPKVLRRLAEAAPDLQVRVADVPPDALVDVVREGRVDFALGTVGPAADVRVRAVLRDTFCVVVSEAHPLATQEVARWRELPEHNVIAPPLGSAIRTTIDETLRELGCDIAPKLEVSLLETILALVDENLGIAVAPKSFCNLERFRNLRLVELREPVVGREVSVVQRAGRGLTPAASFVLGVIEAVLNGER